MSGKFEITGFIVWLLSLHNLHFVSTELNGAYEQDPEQAFVIYTYLMAWKLI
jgi:hypothetical protein